MNIEQARYVVRKLEDGEKEIASLSAKEAQFILDNVDLSGSEVVRVELENRADDYKKWVDCQE